MNKSISILSALFITIGYVHSKDAAAEQIQADEQAAEVAIQGAWEMKNEDGTVRLKFISGGRWAITQCDAETGTVIFHHGGTYKLDGDTYTETVVYANDNTTDLIGKVHAFVIKIDGGALSQVGVGNPWTEEWTRIKE